MEQLLKKLPQLAQEKSKENKRYFDKLKKRPPKDLAHQMEAIHRSVFSDIDCLSCANCCKTTGPLFTTTDIDRIAKVFKMKPNDFIATYLRIDEDQDYVLQQLPCPFLDENNYCFIYDIRPKACREYPHTNHSKFHKITQLTMNNTSICPAAYEVVERMKSKVIIK